MAEEARQQPTPQPTPEQLAGHAQPVRSDDDRDLYQMGASGQEPGYIPDPAGYGVQADGTPRGTQSGKIIQTTQEEHGGLLNNGAVYPNMSDDQSQGRHPPKVRTDEPHVMYPDDRVAHQGEHVDVVEDQQPDLYKFVDSETKHKEPDENEPFPYS